MPYNTKTTQVLCIIVPALTGLCFPYRTDASEWQNYTVYQPHIERSFVVDAAAQPLRYNHDSSVAWFGNRWFCVWNANTIPAEGAPGQLNYVSTSTDGIKWSEASPAFFDAALCSNPIPCPKGTQWQPNLLVVENQLWCLWSQNSRDQHHGCYLSVLEKPDGLWTNHLIQFDGKTDPVIDGKEFRVFPTQNPLQLSGGRILAPVTLIGPESENAPSGLNSWYQREKRDSVIYTDDAGVTWRVSPGAIIPDHDWRQWEPTVCEQPDGSVLMFARNNLISHFEDAGITPQTALVRSVSHDRGATWTPHAYVPIQTVVSRMHILKQPHSDRYLMIHNDWPAGRFVQDRRNLALFINRGGGFDFTAGTGLTDEEFQVAYPQMDIHDNSLMMSYSQGDCGLRSIRAVRISPLPDPEKFFIYPRSNISRPPLCNFIGDALQLRGGSFLKCRVVPRVEPGVFSAEAVISPETGGVIFDNRSGGKGLVWSLSGTCFVHLGEPRFNIRSSMTVPPGRWSTVAVDVDYPAGRVVFTLNGKTEIKKFKPSGHSLQSKSATLFGPNLSSSTLCPFEGHIRLLSLYGTNTIFKAAEAEKQQAARFEMPVIPVAPVSTITVTDESDAGGCLEIRGLASAGVELGANERSAGDKVEFDFSFRIEEEGDATLCTAGDAGQPVRVIVHNGNILLAGAGKSNCFAKACNGRWQLLKLITGADCTRVSVDDFPPAEINHDPEATWIYLGDGFPDGEAGRGCFKVDISSVRSRIEKAGNRF